MNNSNSMKFDLKTLLIIIMSVALVAVVSTRAQIPPTGPPVYSPSIMASPESEGLAQRVAELTLQVEALAQNTNVVTTITHHLVTTHKNGIVIFSLPQ